MVLEIIGLLGISSPRTQAYLDAMVRGDLRPAFVILLHDERAGRLPGQRQGDAPLAGTLDQAGIPYEVIPTTDVNDPRVREAVAARPEEVFIYSGAGGAILRKEILSLGKRFLHVHPGLVPAYRGSTPLYYSILSEGACGASAIFLTERIDGGPVIRTKRYPPPADGTTIDYVYDPQIRADLLLEVLEAYRRDGTFRATDQVVEPGETYYIIHPVLKHLAILACGQGAARSAACGTSSPPRLVAGPPARSAA